MSPLLCRESRATGNDARGSRTGSGRRASRLAGLATAGLALLGLAAAPMGDAGDAVPEAIASALGTTLASVAATALEVPASDGLAERDGRRVRTAVATPPTLAEQTSFEPVPEPYDPAADEPAADQPSADQPATEDGEPAQQDPGRDDDADAGAATTHRSIWDDLADCESGDRDADGTPITGTARWDYGRGFTHEGYEQFEGGLNFEPGTWDAYRDPGMPDHAGDADRAQEIVVAERVQSAQGWSAWPVCSEMLGLQ